MKNETKKLSYIEGIGSIVINIILFILKYWVGIMTGSIAIIADAWHTLSDSLTSIVVILGAKISSKPADDNHPLVMEEQNQSLRSLLECCCSSLVQIFYLMRSKD